jgi:hypothetical protein
MAKRKQEQTVGEILMSDPGHIPPVRTFYLQRDEDVSGTSGTGAVAVGTVFPNGQCVLYWLTVVSSIGIYQSIADLEKIHGHQGKTKIVWS